MVKNSEHVRYISKLNTEKPYTEELRLTMAHEEVVAIPVKNTLVEPE